MLGFVVFHFTQDLHGSWEGGELQSLRGRTDDDGAIFEATADRTPKEYDGALNGKPWVLPHEAFARALPSPLTCGLDERSATQRRG